jgi:hypothetical protein
VTCLWFTPGTAVSSTNKTDGYDITEMLLKVTLNTIALTFTLNSKTNNGKYYDETLFVINKHIAIMRKIENFTQG